MMGRPFTEHAAPSITSTLLPCCPKGTGHGYRLPAKLSFPTQEGDCLALLGHDNQPDCLLHTWPQACMAQQLLAPYTLLQHCPSQNPAVRPALHASAAACDAKVAISSSCMCTVTY